MLYFRWAWTREWERSSTQTWKLQRRTLSTRRSFRSTHSCTETPTRASSTRRSSNNWLSWATTTVVKKVEAVQAGLAVGAAHPLPHQSQLLRPPTARGNRVPRNLWRHHSATPMYIRLLRNVPSLWITAIDFLEQKI